MTEGKIYFYPLWLRIWHGINALGIIILILTGISLQWSIDNPLINFNLSRILHNLAGIVVSVSYLLFFAGNLFTSNWKFYMIKPVGFPKKLMKQARFYTYGMFKGDISIPFHCLKSENSIRFRKFLM